MKQGQERNSLRRREGRKDGLGGPGRKGLPGQMILPGVQGSETGAG